MKALRDEVLAALREAEDAAAHATPGSVECAKAKETIARLQSLHDDIETAIRLGITDRGEFATMFDEARIKARAGS